MSATTDDHVCMVCMQSVPGMEFAAGCACKEKTVHADCLLRTVICTQEDERGIACPVCKTGVFTENDEELLNAAQRNHDKSEEDVDHEDVKLDCYIKYMRSRCKESTDRIWRATVKVNDAIRILKSVADDDKVPGDTRERARAQARELEDGW